MVCRVNLTLFNLYPRLLRTPACKLTDHKASEEGVSGSSRVDHFLDRGRSNLDGLGSKSRGAESLTHSTIRELAQLIDNRIECFIIYVHNAGVVNSAISYGVIKVTGYASKEARVQRSHDVTSVSFVRARARYCRAAPHF